MSVALAILSLLLLAHPALAIEVGQTAPRLVAPALHEATSPVDSSRYRGQVMLIDFWASWCAPCRRSFPALEVLLQKHQASGFVVIGVNQDKSLDDARRFADRVRVSYPLVTDPGNDIARAYSVDAMPTAVLVDRKGNVRHVHRGFTSSSIQQLDAAVQLLIGEPR